MSAYQSSCKMKSQSAILNEHPFEHGDEQTCQDINQAALLYAQSIVPSPTIMRFTSSGIQLRFLEDSVYESSVLWIESELEFYASSDNNTKVYDVVSPTYNSSSGSWFEASGMHYCKLISVFKIAEWMLIDSLPKIPSWW